MVLHSFLREIKKKLERIPFSCITPTIQELIQETDRRINANINLGISFFVKLNNSRRIPSVVTTRYLKMGPSSIIGSQNNGGPKHGE